MSARLKFLVGTVVVTAIGCTWAMAQQPVEVQQPPTPAVTPAPMAAPTMPAIPQSFTFGQAGGGSKDAQATKLAKQYVKAEKEDQKKEIRKQLTDMLSKQFDQHVQQQQKDLESLETQIAELRKTLKKRQDSRSAIVDRRVEQLILDADNMGWNVPNTSITPRPAGKGGVQAKR
jgi:uncharacterized protein HemX